MQQRQQTGKIIILNRYIDCSPRCRFLLLLLCSIFRMQKMYLSLLLVLLLILVPFLPTSLYCSSFSSSSSSSASSSCRVKVKFLLLRIAGTTILWPLHIYVAREGGRGRYGEAEETRKKDKGKFLGLLPVLLLVLVPFGAAHLCQATIRFYCPLSCALSPSPCLLGATTTWHCSW